MVEMHVFTAPVIQENPDGWGPCDTPEQFKDKPYQPFSKDDRLGKVADWTGATYQDRRFANKYATTFVGSHDQYAYYHEDDDNSYKQVFKANTPKPMYHRGRYMRGGRGRGGRGRGQGGPQNQGGMYNMGRGGRKQDPKYQRVMQQRRNFRYPPQKIRDASVTIRPQWRSVEEMDFPRLLKLSLPTVGPPVDLKCCGTMEYYDKSYDRVTVKNERKLERINRVFHKVTTTDDPVIRQLAKGSGNVFATDGILATIMCATRSVYSWDIVVQKIGDKIFFDKRDDSEFDLLSVGETAADPPSEEGTSLNSPRNLSLEATFINHNFSQQVLVPNKKGSYKFPSASPFLEEEATEEVAPVGYRYRRWDLGGGIQLVARTEHDAVMPGQGGTPQFVNVKSLNEWSLRTPGGVDWRQKLDSQRGAVLSNEIKCNACKLAKWTCQALLAGSHHMKIGYVSRFNMRDSTRHVILGTEQFRPQDFATQINLNMDNAWGILRCIIDICMKLEDGKYLLLRDPMKQVIRLFDIPDNTFESDDEGGEEGEDGDGEK